MVYPAVLRPTDRRDIALRLVLAVNMEYDV